MPDPCPFDFAVVRSSVLAKNVLFVRSRKLTVPPDLADLPVFSWPELLHLLSSGVTSADLPRLMAIRDQFGGRFGDPETTMTPRPEQHQIPDRQISSPSNQASVLSQEWLFDDL